MRRILQTARALGLRTFFVPPIDGGMETTLVKDAIASLSWDQMKATLEVNAPLYANPILTTEELVSELTAQAGAAAAQ